jgi:hypothetical protein
MGKIGRRTQDAALLGSGGPVAWFTRDPADRIRVLGNAAGVSGRHMRCKGGGVRRLYLLLLLICFVVPGCAGSGGAVGGGRARWELAKGGLLPAGAANHAGARAAAALARVSAGVTGRPLRIAVLRNAEPVAYSFRDGSVYVSTGLAGLLSDDELAAAVAHEVGHLILDGVVGPEPRGLAGGDGGGRSVEGAADGVGRRLLAAQGVPPGAMARALEKVAARSRGQACYADLCRRAAALRALELAE